MAKYKLIKKVNPQKRQEPGKWYATPKSETPLSGKAMTCAATANTTTAPIEMEASLELLAKFVPQQLQQGHTVKIPGLGTFRLTFKSDGVEDINSFRANSIDQERPDRIHSLERIAGERAQRPYVRGRRRTGGRHQLRFYSRLPFGQRCPGGRRRLGKPG